MTMIKKQTSETMKNLQSFYTAKKVNDYDVLGEVIANFLKGREVGKLYHETEIRQLLTRDYLRITQNKKRAAGKKNGKQNFSKSIEEYSIRSDQNLITEDVFKVIKNILTAKQYVILQDYLNDGLINYKLNLKGHNRQKKRLERIFKKLSSYKSIFVGLTGDNNLDSFCDSYSAKAIFKGVNKEKQKYSTKPSNDFIYDVKSLHPDKIKTLVSNKIENKFLTGNTIYSNKLIGKKVKSSSTGLTGYQKYQNNTEYYKKEKQWLETIQPDNMVHLKGERNLDHIGDKTPEQVRIIVKPEKLVARFGFYPDQLLTLNKKNAKKVNGVAVYRDGRPIEKFLTYYHEKELGNNTLINNYMIKIGLKTDWKRFNKCD